MVTQSLREAGDCPPPPVPPVPPPPPDPTTKTVPSTAPSRRYGYLPGCMKGTLRVPSGAKLKEGNARPMATILCCRVPRLVQSTLPPAGTTTLGGVSAPSAIVTEGPDVVAPSRTTSTPTLITARPTQLTNIRNSLSPLRCGSGRNLQRPWHRS